MYSTSGRMETDASTFLLLKTQQTLMFKVLYPPSNETLIYELSDSMSNSIAILYTVYKKLAGNQINYLCE